MSKQAEEPTTDELEAVVATFFEHFNAHDVEKMLLLCEEKLVVEYTSPNDVTTEYEDNLDGFRDRLIETFKLYPDYQVKTKIHFTSPYAPTEKDAVAGVTVTAKFTSGKEQINRQEVNFFLNLKKQITGIEYYANLDWLAGTPSTSRASSRRQSQDSDPPSQTR